MALTESPQALSRQYHEPGRPGQPWKCTPEVTEAIAEDIRTGMPPVHAAIRNGISKPTHHRWLVLAEGIERRVEEYEGQAAEHAEHVAAGEKALTPFRGAPPEPLALTDVEVRLRAYREAVSKAELDWLHETVKGIKSAAYPHRARRTAVREQVLKEGGKILYDEEGKPRTVQLREVTETEESEARIMLALIERRFPAEFQATVRAELTGEGGGPIAVEVTEVEQRLAGSLRERLQTAGVIEVTDAEVIDVEEVSAGAPVVVDEEPEEYAIVASTLDDYGF